MKLFVCKECHKQAGEEYVNSGCFGPCEICGNICGIVLVSGKKLERIKNILE